MVGGESRHPIDNLTAISPFLPVHGLEQSFGDGWYC